MEIIFLFYTGSLIIYQNRLLMNVKLIDSFSVLPRTTPLHHDVAEAKLTHSDEEGALCLCQAMSSSNDPAFAEDGAPAE